MNIKTNDKNEPIGKKKKRENLRNRSGAESWLAKKGEAGMERKVRRKGLEEVKGGRRVSLIRQMCVKQLSPPCYI